MANNESSIDCKKDAQGKNTEIIFCSYCPSKMLNPGAATFHNIQVSYKKELSNENIFYSNYQNYSFLLFCNVDSFHYLT